MKKALVIAKNTFKETIRDKIFYGILGFAILFILLSLFLSKLSLGEVVEIKSFGLAGIYVFGLITTIFLGASIISKEIEKRSLYLVLSKPVSRFEVLLGKFIGLLSAVVLTTVLMAFVYIAVVFYGNGGFDYLGLLSIFFQILEMSIFVSLLTMLSSVLSPLSATICSVMVLFVGHLLKTALDNAARIGGLTYKAISLVYYLLPNLEKFNIRNLVVHNVSVSPGLVFLAIVYAVVYSTALLYIAKLIFERREL